jgi:hypothetical protein
VIHIEGARIHRAMVLAAIVPVSAAHGHIAGYKTTWTCKPVTQKANAHGMLFRPSGRHTHPLQHPVMQSV